MFVSFRDHVRAGNHFVRNPFPIIIKQQFMYLQIIISFRLFTSLDPESFIISIIVLIIVLISFLLISDVS